jgi:hypothetical protein
MYVIFREERKLVSSTVCNLLHYFLSCARIFTSWLSIHHLLPIFCFLLFKSVSVIVSLLTYLLLLNSLLSTLHVTYLLLLPFRISFYLSLFINLVFITFIVTNRFSFISLITYLELLDRNYYNSDGDAQLIRKWSQYMGRFVRYHPLTVTADVAFYFLSAWICVAVIHTVCATKHWQGIT